MVAKKECFCWEILLFISSLLLIEIELLGKLHSSLGQLNLALLSTVVVRKEYFFCCQVNIPFLTD